MKGIINGFNWVEAEPMRYWSFPKSYKKNPKEEVRQLIFSNTYIGSLKRDGYYQRIVKDEDGQVFMIARNRDTEGQVVNKVDWMPQFQDFFQQLPNGTCLLSEIYIPEKEGSKNITAFLGCLQEKCIQHQQEQGYLHLYIFDVMAYNQQNLIETSISNRIKYLEKLPRAQYVEIAQYYRGAELYNKIGEYLAQGNEGAVITREDCKVYFKRTPARLTIKIKKELSDSVDCIILGANPPSVDYTGEKIEDWPYWQNLLTNEKIYGKFYQDYFTGTAIKPITKAFFNGWAGSLCLGMYNRNKEIVKIGNLSRLPEEILKNWQNYKGKVVEISAMEIIDSKSQGLRHPKFIQIREDKSPKDCIFEEVFKP